MTRNLIPLAVLLALLATPRAVHAAPPRLVVVVSIDQFRRDYLDRFGALFPPGGFRRLLDEGADFTSCHHQHAITYTGPGHAVMLTGSYPVHSGIVANNWFARASGARMGCVEDDRFPLLGAGEGAEGGVSPLALLGGTVGDELRAGTLQRAKVVSISIKDRGAVMLAGRRPNGAYWFDASTCRFVSSTYYADALPEWVQRFNASAPCAASLGTRWEKLRPDLDYARYADADDAPYERDAVGLGRAFPHPIAEFIDVTATGWAREANRYAAVVSSPEGNELVRRFASAAIAFEALGEDDVPDILTLSLSSNDYVGHMYGPYSQEVMDIALRTDRMLATLMAELDRMVGTGRWTLALTSDHGTAPIPEYLEQSGLLPPRADHYRIDIATARAQVERALAQRFFGAATAPADFPGFFAAWDDRTTPFVWVNPQASPRLPKPMPFDDLLDAVRSEMERVDGFVRIYTRRERPGLAASQDIFDLATYRSWQAENGGDLFIQTAPYWLVGTRYGTTHGTPYAYDTHVPMLLYGAGIRAGRHARVVAVADLASTLAQILGIAPPPSNEGQPLREALE